MAEKAITWYNRLKEAINGQIKQNGKREITGVKLNSVLNQMVDVLGKNMTFGGEVNPATVIDNTDDNPVFYLALEAGNYPYCGNIVVGQGQIAFLFRDANNIWHQASWNAPDENFTEEEKEKLQGLPTVEELREALGAKANAPESKPGSDNLASFDEDGNLKDSGVSIPVPTEEEKEHVLSSGENGLEWVPKPVDGADAYGVYVKEYKEGHEGSTDGMLTRPQWLLSLKGEKGDDAVNPFKGWFDSSDDIPTQGAKKGDYAYVTTNGTSKIWKHNGTAFVNTNETVSQEQTFNSNERLSAVKIDDTHLDNPVGDDETNAPTLAKAEDVMQIKAKMKGVMASEVKVTPIEEWYPDGSSSGGYNINKGWIESAYKSTRVPVNGYDRIRFIGYNKNFSTNKYAYGFLNSDSQPIGNFIEYYNADIQTVGKCELEIKVPAGAAYFVCLCQAWSDSAAYQIFQSSDFYCYLQSGDNVVDTINKSIDVATQPIKGDINRINEQMYVVVRTISKGSTKNHYIKPNTDVNYWQNSGETKHYNVVVNPGDIIKIEAQANYLARYAFLKEIPELANNITTGTIPVNYADDCTLEKIDAGGYVIVQVPTDAYCLYVFAGRTEYSYPYKANLYLLRKLKDIVVENAKGTTIFDYNQDEYIKPRLDAATHPIRTSVDIGNDETETVFDAGSVVFGHISDCHGYDSSGTETERRWNEFIDFCKYWKEKGFIDELVDTGDVLKANYNNNHNYIGWRTNAEDVLTIIGNHDTWNGNNKGWAAHAGRDAYDMLIKDNVDNWGVVQPTDAESNGYCYYYKDYFKDNLKDNGFEDGDARKLETCLRAIYVDCMGFDETQYNWVKGLLDEARNGIVGEYTALNPFGGSVAVVIFTHFPPMTWRTIPCSYSARRSPSESVTPGKYNDFNIHFANLARAVHNFQLEDGIFAGYVCGHYHYDAIGKVVGGYKFTEYEEEEQTIYFNNDKYTQLVYAVSSGNVSFGVKLSDYKMEDACESQNSFQLISFDVDDKKTRLIKIGSRTDAYMRRKDTIAVTFNKYNDFDDSTDYSVNSRVVYEGKLYRFIVRHYSNAWDYADVVEDNRILE